MATEDSWQIPNSGSDPFHLASEDHPGMSLTKTRFSGESFLGWSRSIKMALAAKMKLGFVDGTLPKPALTDPNFQNWTRSDYMVRSWILNSMESDLADTFLYAESSENLWKEIVERFGHTNAPQIYQIQKDLNEIKQGNLSVAAYFAKLKKCWDELHVLNGLPVCSCGKLKECLCEITEKFIEMENRNKLMQFLLKLRGEYDDVKSHILSLDPLPNVNRAFYIVQLIESQKSLSKNIPDVSAFTTGFPGRKPQESGKKDSRKSKGFEKKYCRHCRSEGHTFDQCFERIGYPDWFKGKRNRKLSRVAAHIGNEDMLLDTPLDGGFEGIQESTKDGIDQPLVDGIDQRLVDAVCSEMVKMFRGKGTMGNQSEMLNAVSNFADVENSENGWEMRPGGMPVQMRENGVDDNNENGVDDNNGGGGPMIKIKVSYGSSVHDFIVPCQSTFGGLKKLLVPITGLEPEDQKLIFRGREKDGGETLHMAGLKDLSKLLLLERPAGKERKMEGARKKAEILKACEAVSEVRSEVDKLSQKVSSLQASVHSGMKVDQKEFIISTELFMVQLLKLDSIKADGEAKAQRKNEVRRIQGYVDMLDALKAKNCNPVGTCSKTYQ